MQLAHKESKATLGPLVQQAQSVLQVLKAQQVQQVHKEFQETLAQLVRQDQREQQVLLELQVQAVRLARLERQVHKVVTTPLLTTLTVGQMPLVLLATLCTTRGFQMQAAGLTP